MCWCVAVPAPLHIAPHPPMSKSMPHACSMRQTISFAGADTACRSYPDLLTTGTSILSARLRLRKVSYLLISVYTKVVTVRRTHPCSLPLPRRHSSRPRRVRREHQPEESPFSGRLPSPPRLPFSNELFQSQGASYLSWQACLSALPLRRR